MPTKYKTRVTGGVSTIRALDDGGSEVFEYHYFPDELSEAEVDDEKFVPRQIQTKGYQTIVPDKYTNVAERMHTLVDVDQWLGTGKTIYAREFYSRKRNLNKTITVLAVRNSDTSALSKKEIFHKAVNPSVNPRLINNRLLLDGRQGISYAEYIRGNNLTTHDKLKLIKSAIQSLANCHKAGYVYRNLNLNKILINPAGSSFLTDGKMAVKIGFPIPNTTVDRTAEMKDSDSSVAPFSINEKANPSMDVFRLGVLMKEILNLKEQEPFKGLLSQCLEKNSGLRPTLDQINIAVMAELRRSSPKQAGEVKLEGQAGNPNRLFEPKTGKGQSSSAPVLK